MRSQVIITIVLIIVLILPLSFIYAGDNSAARDSAELHDKDRYTEDSVGVDGKLFKVKIDPEAKKVAYFWDDKSNAWADVSLCPTDLNKAYTEKMTFKDMQNELNRAREKTWDDRYRY